MPSGLAELNPNWWGWTVIVIFGVITVLLDVITCHGCS